MSKSERLCEVRDALFVPIIQLIKEQGAMSDAMKLRLELQELECPAGRGHCDPSKPCQGFTRENRMRISRIEDGLFEKGFIKK